MIRLALVMILAGCAAPTAPPVCTPDLPRSEAQPRANAGDRCRLTTVVVSDTDAVPYYTCCQPD